MSAHGVNISKFTERIVVMWCSHFSFKVPFAFKISELRVSVYFTGSYICICLFTGVVLLSVDVCICLFTGVVLLSIAGCCLLTLP